MKEYGEVDLQIHFFFISALVGGQSNIFHVAANAKELTVKHSEICIL
jgi:hypothetical protein